MTDVVDSMQRTGPMASIRERDTASERAVRSTTHRMRLRFRQQRSVLSGGLDLVRPTCRLTKFAHRTFLTLHKVERSACAHTQGHAAYYCAAGRGDSRAKRYPFSDGHTSGGSRPETALRHRLCSAAPVETVPTSVSRRRPATFIHQGGIRCR